MKPTLPAFIVLLPAVVVSAAEPPRARPLNYNRDVRPILSDKCFACHGPDAKHREADLRLDDEASAKLDRGGYAAILSGKPDESELIRRITSEDESERMPPAESGKQLTPAEVKSCGNGSRKARHGRNRGPTRRPSARLCPRSKTARGRGTTWTISSWRGWRKRACVPRRKPTA
jgi:hypothetical protein